MKALNPATLAEATPGNRVRVGDVYLVAAEWIGDGWLADCLGELGRVLHDVRKFPKPDDGVWKALRPDGLKKRSEIAARYREAVCWLVDGADGKLPPELTEWLSLKLAAVAEAVASNNKPAPAVCSACGARRTGRRGNLPADHYQHARDAALAWEVEYQRRRAPAPEHELFERVAELWSQGRHQISAAVVQAAWKRRRDFS